uniref:EF-hand domain-containing protein n=1 Tax=Chromera velia CCMP2878 TaxID=1169474 RepID=A0A0G4FV91_9ALVE|mmetsp:Transcript_13528/g.26826  ORF Transcript_13528/g.26826 Transcript_13528/m.26826 type:complete len:168 (-) Transcript_13528:232-735(-)|eukprot:Cvel_487.t1-p1 / transcript=Cvel_487.t1 / gene=Cvel_487 / organism=Chromera_velia_CCMP2878 / gene_product=Caltractin, putative / transcript_product=Caltractin, putative / location=Cvel_scaffold15:106694-109959(-) / protein_length=167 / sequence_SO=supercontig / SO=protein_coding / is_pseudo=false
MDGGSPLTDKEMTYAEKEEKAIREGFRLLDEDGSGKISVNELEAHFDDYGFSKEAVKKAIQRVLAQVDGDGSREIEEDEFVSLMTKKLGKNDNDADIVQSYRHFDNEGKGFISMRDMKETCQKLGDTADEDRLKEMLMMASRGKQKDPKNPTISQDEFVILMKKDLE